jgi:hypothetical protein
MTTQTEAERLADQLEDPVNAKLYLAPYIAAELRRLVSLNNDLMDEVARLTKAVADEREACAKLCDAFQARGVGMQPAECAGAIRSRGNT